jgi:hypothetical protein
MAFIAFPLAVSNRPNLEMLVKENDDRLHIGALLYPYLVVPLWGITGTLRIYLCGSSVVASYPTSMAFPTARIAGFATNRLPLFV